MGKTDEISGFLARLIGEKSEKPHILLVNNEARFAGIFVPGLIQIDRNERLTLPEQPFLSLDSFLANVLMDSQSQPIEKVAFTLGLLIEWNKVDYYAQVPTIDHDSSFSVPSATNAAGFPSLFSRY